MPKYVDLTLDRASAEGTMDDATRDVIRTLRRRLNDVRQEHDQFILMCDRFDKLYYADVFTQGGADLWPDDPSATTKGRSHVSANTPSVYVDIPSSLQATTPIENMLSTEDTEEGRTAAADLERLYTAWKNDQDFDLKFHKATTVKALYGRTAGRVYWDDIDEGESKPRFEVIEQPRNLWLGYKTDEYNDLEWAAYALRFEPNALAEQYGIELNAKKLDDGTVMPIMGGVSYGMQFPGMGESSSREWLNFGDARVEVWDYWYRKPQWSGRGKNRKARMVTCNVVVAGNVAIQGPTEYPEYKGKLPYVPLYNTFVPGIPNGRSELHDAEQLIREKFEKITAGSQMIQNGVAGDYWQLVGPDAPARVPAGLKPKRNELVGPGPGNRIEVITPFIAQFQLEQYLGRLDRELAVITGLNDLIIGLAPVQSLSSSKAINALIANYEARISMRRKLLYAWRRKIWELAVQVWSEHDDRVKSILGNGAGVLEIIDPSLSPRDDMETAQRAINLVNGKLWSQRRAMDAVGVDDPEQEQELIREERTDATMFPADVQVMAQLMQVLQSIGLQAPAAQNMAEDQLGNAQNDLRNSLGAATPDNSVGMQSPDTLGMTPPIEGAGPNAGGPQPPFAAATQPAVMEGMLQGGQAKSRIMTKTKLPLSQAKLGRR